jgi:hypothetical protein
MKFISKGKVLKTYKLTKKTDKKQSRNKERNKKKRNLELRIIVDLESIAQIALSVLPLLYATARVFLSEKDVWHFLLLAEFL